MPPAGDLDPEELSEWIAPFHNLVADVASRFGGFIAQLLGDGAHVYFGYPAAHEYDAEHAVQALRSCLRCTPEERLLTWPF